MQELERYFVVSKDIQSFHVKVLSNIFLEYKIAEDFLKSLADEFEVEHLICKVLESCPQETTDTPPRGGVDGGRKPTTAAATPCEICGAPTRKQTYDVCTNENCAGYE